MTRLAMFWLAAASLAVPAVAASPFAENVVNYSSGTGFSPGFNNPANALGGPTAANPNPFGGPIDPFTPPYLSSQLVSIGMGGSLTVSFGQTLANAPGNLFGLDFIVFGNNGFAITNNNFEGGGITDGSTFTFDPPGNSKVLVSADNITFYELVPPSGLATTLDALFPTDSFGDPSIPVNPALARENFAGLDLVGIRNLYGHSAGGTGFDLAWAQTTEGQPAPINDIRYVRIDVLSGKIEVDAFAVVPEPHPGALWAAAGLLGCLARLRAQRYKALRISSTQAN